MRSLTWEQVIGRRLERSRLLARDGRLVEVASAVCGVQAQVQLAAELALGMRGDGWTRDDTLAALWERRELVKTWSLRGTLHLHGADDLPLWIAASNTVEPWWHDERRLEPFGLRREQAEAILQALLDALDGRALGSEQLGEEIAAGVGAWATAATGVIQFGRPALRWRQLLGAAVARGQLCFGPPQGSRSTYVRADQWLGGWREIDPETALAEAFRRYLTAYGPATTEDFAHWFGHGVDAVARELPGRIGEELEPVEVEGSACWLLAGDTTFPDRPAPSVRLLAHYDCYLIGAAPPGPSRDRLVPAAAGSRIFDRGGGPSPAVLVDGVVAGTWSRRARGKRLEIRIELFQSLSASQRRALESEVGRIGRFLGAEAQLTE